MNVASIDDTASLLREREARSLSLMSIIALAGFLVVSVQFAFQMLTTPHDNVRVAAVSGYLGFNITVTVVLLLVLRRRLWVTGIGVIVALLSATFAAIAGLVMWRGFADQAPASLLTKLPIAAVGMAAIAAMSLTLRPLYVVIVGTGVALTLLGFFGLAALDPATVFAANSAEPYTSRAVSQTRLVFELVFVGGATASGAFAAHLARRTVREAAALQRSANQLSRYFSPDIASGIRGGGEAFGRPGGREQEVVVMFSDLVGFTPTCAGLTASQALALLSEYQERMVTEIFSARGTLDKFIGDGIMATFGTPEPAADAADRAVRAARGMMAAIAALNRDRAARGDPPLAQRIGIHAGPAMVGNVGTNQRLEFSVIGDTVNVANRIEAACKKTGRQAMISVSVAEKLSDRSGLEPLGPVALDGQPLPIELYALA